MMMRHWILGFALLSATAGAIAASPHAEEPILAELFGPARLEQHAKSLAAADRAISRQ